MAAMAGLSVARAATTHLWSGAGGDGLFSNPANWFSGGTPAPGATVILHFPASGTTQAVMNVAGLIAESITITRTQFTLAGAGLPITVKNVTVASNSTVTFAETLPLRIYSNGCQMVQLSNTTVRLNSPLQGTGSLDLMGWGQFVVGGSLANSNTGPTDIIGVSVRMAKPVGVNAFGGDVEVRSGANLYWDAHQQLPNSGTTLTVDNYYGQGTAVWIGRSETLGTLRLVANPNSFSWETDFNLSFGLLTLSRLELFGVRRVYNAQISIGQALTATNCGLGLQFEAPLNVMASAQGVRVQTDNNPANFYAPISGPSNAVLRFECGGTWEVRLRATNTFEGTTYLDSGGVEIFTPGALGTTNNPTVVGEHGTLVIATNMTLAEPLVLFGTTNEVDEVWPQVGAMVKVYDHTQVTATLSGGMVVSNHVGLSLSAYEDNSLLIVTGVISGPGRIHKFREGVLRFSGSQPNTFTGGFDVWDGVVDLQRPANTTSLPGPATVRSLGTLRSAANHQIADAASVFIRNGGVWDVQNFSETIGNLDFFSSGTVNGFGGALQVNGTISARELGAYATINAPLLLGASGTIADVDDAPSSIPLRFTGNVSGGFLPTLTKTGSGRLELWGANTFLGSAFIEEGTLAMKSASALGGTVAGTTVSDGGVLEVNFPSGIYNEPLSLIDGGVRLNGSGTNIFGGAITLAGLSWIETPFAQSRWLLTNIISGAGDLAKSGPGVLELGGTSPNTYAGYTWLTDGALALNKLNGPAVSGTGLAIGFHPLTFAESAGTVHSLRAGQIGGLTLVGLSAASMWNMNNFSETIGGLAGAGTIDAGSATLTQGAAGVDTVFNGQISGVSGSVTMVKQGAGVFTMLGNIAYPGSTAIAGGKLLVNGTNASLLTTIGAGATLGGSGQLGNVLATGGQVSPGNSPGLLKSGWISWNGATTYRCEIAGTNAGTQYDQLAVTGTVNLGNATLELAVTFAGAVSNRYTIIANDGTDAVGGTFAGLPEGAVFTRGGAQFRISYAGGTGNDVVLTQLAPTDGPHITSIAPFKAGQMTVTGAGLPNQTYEFQATTNLVNPVWETLIIVVTDSSGVLNVLDSDAGEYPMRFYRFALP